MGGTGKWPVLVILNLNSTSPAFELGPRIDPLNGFFDDQALSESRPRPGRAHFGRGQAAMILAVFWPRACL